MNLKKQIINLKSFYNLNSSLFLKRNFSSLLKFPSNPMTHPKKSKHFPILSISISSNFSTKPTDNKTSESKINEKSTTFLEDIIDEYMKFILENIFQHDVDKIKAFQGISRESAHLPRLTKYAALHHLSRNEIEEANNLLSTLDKNAFDDTEVLWLAFCVKLQQRETSEAQRILSLLEGKPDFVSSLTNAALGFKRFQQAFESCSSVTLDKTKINYEYYHQNALAGYGLGLNLGKDLLPGSSLEQKFEALVIENKNMLFPIVLLKFFMENLQRLKVEILETCQNQNFFAEFLGFLFLASQNGEALTLINSLIESKFPEKNNKNIKTLLEIAQVLLNSSHENEAKNLLKRIDQSENLKYLTSDDVTQLSSLYTVLNSHEEAIKILEFWKKSNPEDLAIYNQLVKIYRALGEEEKLKGIYLSIIQIYEKRLSSSPDDLSLLLILADFYKLAGRTKEYINKLNKILKFKPDSIEIYSDLINFYEENQNEKAKIIKKMIDTYPQKLTDLGDIFYFEKKDFETALDIYEQKIKSHPDNLRALYMKYRCLMELERENEASLHKSFIRNHHEERLNKAMRLKEMIDAMYERSHHSELDTIKEAFGE